MLCSKQARIEPEKALAQLRRPIPASVPRHHVDIALVVHRRRLTLLNALLSTKLGRPLSPTEEAAVSLAIHEATGQADGATTLVDPTLPQVWAVLRDP